MLTIDGAFQAYDDGLLTNLRGYWNLDVMQFGQAGKDD